jgi:CopG family nickel-responsive transcriptional regulator
LQPSRLSGKGISDSATNRGDKAVQRITITIDDDLLAAVDTLMTQRGYTSRSEAFRDIVRDSIDRRGADDPDAACIATLSYVYDHATRDLAGRLTGAYHHRHDLAVASMHVHLDHEACLEVSVLRGSAGAVGAFADALATQRGVRHARLHTIPVKVSSANHRHGDDAAAHPHVHA